MYNKAWIYIFVNAGPQFFISLRSASQLPLCLRARRRRLFALSICTSYLGFLGCTDCMSAAALCRTLINTNLDGVIFSRLYANKRKMMGRLRTILH